MQHPPNRHTRNSARNIFSSDSIRWAISTQKPYKAPGGDGIFPALLHHGIDILLESLVSIFRSSYELSYIPTTWRKVNVVFIPKAGCRSQSDPKAFRPISLTSVFLKVMEKIIDFHIRNSALLELPLNKLQFAYQPGKSTVSALHHLVSTIEETLLEKDIALCSFLDISGAFDNTTFQSIKDAADAKGIDPQTTSWICSMLSSRIISAKLGQFSISAKTTKGCPQGGVLSPLLWSIVVDKILNDLNNCGFLTQGYADDIVIIIRGKEETNICDRMQHALNKVSNWCQTEGLTVNPDKTVIIPFTRRRSLNLRTLSLRNVQINFSKETKYLGITLDQKLCVLETSCR